MGNIQRWSARSVLAGMVCIFSLSASPLSSALWHPRKPTANPSLSAQFLPIRIIPEDAGQMPLFRRMISKFQTDSTRHWELRNGQLEISYDLLHDLASGNLPATGRGFGGRLTTFLGQKHGLRFRSSSSSFGVFTPDDQWYAGSPQWALHNTGSTIADRPGKAGVDINIEKVWDKFVGADSLVIAVVDAGFNFHHPDLQGKNWVNASEAGGKPNVDDDNNGFVDDSLGWDFVDNDNYPDDFHGHGTYCSSIIAASFDNEIGITGIVPQCRIMPVRVLDASGHGDQNQIAKAIIYAVNNGAKAINFSIGGEGDNTAMRNAFQYARDKGVPIIVAAGNDGTDIDANPTYPAAYNFDNILVVAAHDHAGLFSGFSCFGKNNVDLAAPGELVLVAGIPDPKEVWKEDFELANLGAWTFGAGTFALSSADPVADKQSLIWASGANVSAATVAYIDITNREGCVVKFQLNYHPANTGDVLLVEGNIEGSAIWKEIGIIGSDIKPDMILAYGLQDFDGTKFKLRFRTVAKVSSSGRVLKIDGIFVTARDPNPPSQAIYPVIAGTSIAAPHVTAYVGLQRLACDRMGEAWTRARALQGVVTEAAFTGKVATGGRLDVFKGLQFYLATLPDFHVTDSSALVWRVGEQAHYTLELVPAPAPTYKFSVAGLGKDVSIDGVGKLSWVPGVNDTGTHTVTLFAQGPTVLRKRFALTVQPGISVAVKPGKVAGTNEVLGWRVGDQDFRLPPELAIGRHWVEIWGVNVEGKTQLLQKQWAEAVDFRHSWNLRPVSASIARVQVRVDGLPLARSN